MSERLYIAFAACVLLATSLGAAPATDTAKAIEKGGWYLSLSPGAKDQVRFMSIDPDDANRLFLRRFVTPSFYVDALSGDQLKVLLWPRAKELRLAFAGDGSSFKRQPESVEVEYKRATPLRAGGSLSPYEGEWNIGDPAMTVSIRACEQRAWTLVMYFPGDPLSAIPMGYYPLAPAGDGELRSSSAYPDSLIVVEYDPVSESLLIRPLFKERPLAEELYDPVRAWRAK